MLTADNIDDPNTNRVSFESLSKLFGISLAVAYLVGFLVVTRYLSRYGVSSFAIFQLQYLVAGIWVIAPIVVMAFMQKASQEFTNRALRTENEGKVSWRRRLLVMVATNIPGVLTLSAFAVYVAGVEGLTLRMAVYSLLFYTALRASADLLWVSWRTPPHLRQTWWATHHNSPFYATLLTSIFLAYAFFFAIRVYPVIPYSLGGGKPLTVVFLLGDKRVPGVSARDSSSRVSLPYKLLASTDKSFFILSSDSAQESIEFNRDAVVGVVVLREPPNARK